MMYNKKFDIQLGQGEAIEENLREFFEGKRIEVKSERYIWEKTGNHFLEYEYKGQPSGIAATEADFWAFVMVKDEQIVITYITPVYLLKRIARQYYNTDRDVIGGDGNNSKGILVPITDIAHAYKFI